MTPQEAPKELSPFERAGILYAQGAKYDALIVVLENTSLEDFAQRFETAIIEPVSVTKPDTLQTIAEAIADESRPAEERLTLEFASIGLISGMRDFWSARPTQSVSVQTRSQFADPSWLQYDLDKVLLKTRPGENVERMEVDGRERVVRTELPPTRRYRFADYGFPLPVNTLDAIDPKNREMMLNRLAGIDTDKSKQKGKARKEQKPIEPIPAITSIPEVASERKTAASMTAAEREFEVFVKDWMTENGVEYEDARQAVLAFIQQGGSQNPITSEALQVFRKARAQEAIQRADAVASQNLLSSQGDIIEF